MAKLGLELSQNLMEQSIPFLEAEALITKVMITPV